MGRSGPVRRCSTLQSRPRRSSSRATARIGPQRPSAAMSTGISPGDGRSRAPWWPHVISQSGLPAAQAGDGRSRAPWWPLRLGSGARRRSIKGTVVATCRRCPCAQGWPEPATVDQGHRGGHRSLDNGNDPRRRSIKGTVVATSLVVLTARRSGRRATGDGRSRAPWWPRCPSAGSGRGPGGGHAGGLSGPGHSRPPATVDQGHRGGHSARVSSRTHWR